MTTLSPVWIIYFHELSAFFAEDPDIKITYNNDDYEIKMFVNDADKADALMEVLPEVKHYGNIDLKITIIPADTKKARRTEVSDGKSLVERIFKNNAAVVDIVSTDFFTSNPITYVIFKNKVVQYYTDDLSDAFGLESTLYEIMARDLLDEKDLPDVYYSTDKPEESVKSYPNIP